MFSFSFFFELLIEIHCGSPELQRRRISSFNHGFVIILLRVHYCQNNIKNKNMIRRTQHVTRASTTELKIGGTHDGRWLWWSVHVCSLLIICALLLLKKKLLVVHSTARTQMEEEYGTRSTNNNTGEENKTLHRERPASTKASSREAWHNDAICLAIK